MIGAIIGDVAGSRFEWDNHKSKNFELFTPACSLTDDSILSLALARAVLETKDNRDDLPSRAVFCMQKLGRQYPDAGYGELFIRWLGEEDPSPSQSYGNGSAMRVSPAAWAGSSLEEVLRLTDQITAVTHNHPEGMRGAEAVAAAIYLARCGKTKDEIRDYISEHYDPLLFTIDELRPSYTFDATCRGSVPEALEAFFESSDFEDAVRTAVSLGGDSDTIAAMAGSVAEAYYGVPADLIRRTVPFLDRDLMAILLDFERMYPSKAMEDGSGERLTVYEVLRQCGM